MAMLDIVHAMRQDAFFCFNIINTVIFDCFPSVSLEKAVKNPFSKKEMANFGYDDDVLLEWEITGTGRCVGSYSHFNSMMRAEQIWNKATMIGNRFYGANNPQVKISGNVVVVGEERCGCEARNTYTCGAEAGEVNEMN